MATVDRLEHDLGPVARFINTHDLEPESDELTSPEALGVWLRGESLVEPGYKPAEADLDKARAVREALRLLALRNNGIEIDDQAARELLSEVADAARLGLDFTANQPALVPRGDGIDAALGPLLARVFSAAERGDWDRLKACAKHSCQWVFIDHSKNASRTWCSMKVCGNRVKASKYRERRSEEH